MFPTITPAARIFIFLFAGFFLVGLFARDLAWGLMALTGPTILPGLQLWRLLTYPFIIGGFFSLISVGLVLYFFGSELESIMKPNRFAYALLAVILAGGLVFALLIPNGVLAGPEIVTIFVVTGFAYMWPRRELSVLGIFNIQSWVIAAVFILLALIPSSGTRLNTSWSKIYAPLFGALGALVYFHVMYRQYKFGAGLLNAFSRISPRGSKPQRSRSEEEPTQVRVDRILDKIASKGIGSLTDEERAFLDRSSRS